MSDLDCPVCYDPYTGDIFQCQNGHLFCGACDAKFQKRECPECRVELPAIGKTPMNRFAMKLNAERNAECENRCAPNKMTPAEAQTHRDVCERRVLACPVTAFCDRLHLDEKCDVKCSGIGGLIAHLKDKHKLLEFAAGAFAAYAFDLPGTDDLKGREAYYRVYHVLHEKALIFAMWRVGYVSFIAVSLRRSATGCLLMATTPKEAASRSMWTMSLMSIDDLATAENPSMAVTSANEKNWTMAFHAHEKGTITKFMNWLSVTDEVRQPPAKKRRL